jgi:site-specific DNA-methyltransferase (adenine-specific)
MVWLKNHFANALVAKAAPVSYYEDINVFFRRWDTGGAHPLRVYAQRVLAAIGKTNKAVALDLKHQRADHFFRYASTQFALCTEEVYAELTQRYELNRLPWWKSYAELKRDNARFERCFNLPDGARFKSNVLKYHKDSGAFHPTQKPVALMEDIIRTYTNPGDTVLDNSMGSGTTGVACVNTGRSFIGIEKDPGYFTTASARIEAARLQKEAA